MRNFKITDLEILINYFSKSLQHRLQTFLLEDYTTNNITASNQAVYHVQLSSLTVDTLSITVHKYEHEPALTRTSISNYKIFQKH